MVHSTTHGSLSGNMKIQMTLRSLDPWSIRIKKKLKEWNRFTKAVKLLIQPSLQMNSKKKNKKQFIALFRVAFFSHLIRYSSLRHIKLQLFWLRVFLIQFMKFFFFFLTHKYSLVSILLFCWRLIWWICVSVFVHYYTPMYASIKSKALERIAYDEIHVRSPYKCFDFYCSNIFHSF